MHPKRRAPIAVMVAILMVACACQAVFAEDNPFGTIHVVTSRTRYSGTGCPIDVTFTARINFMMPHPKGFAFNYHWERSDGAKSPVQVVHPTPGQSSIILHEAWRVGAPGNQYSISQTLFVNSGNTHLSETSPTVPIICR